MSLFFGALRRVATNTRRLDQNAFFNEFFNDRNVQKLIIKLNTQDQLFEDGITATGEGFKSRSGGVYTRLSEELNLQRSFTLGGITKDKKEGEPYILFDSGDFFKSFRVKVNFSNFVIEADTVKPTQNLLDFGEILGLTDENLQEVIEFFEAFLLAEVRKEITAGNI
jgi:hypothetical protein